MKEIKKRRKRRNLRSAISQERRESMFYFRQHSSVLWIIIDNQLPPATALLYNYLCMNCNITTKRNTCAGQVHRIHYDQIAKDLSPSYKGDKPSKKVHPNTVRKWINMLEDIGLVQVTERNTGYFCGILPHMRLIEMEIHVKKLEKDKQAFYQNLKQKVYKEQKQGAQVDFRFMTDTEQDYIVRLHRELGEQWKSVYDPRSESAEEIRQSLIEFGMIE